MQCSAHRLARRHNKERSIPHILTQQRAFTTSPLLHSGTNRKIWHKSNCRRHSRVQLIHWWRWFNQWNVFISVCCKIYELQIPVCVSIFRYYLPNFILDYHISQQQTLTAFLIDVLSQYQTFFLSKSWIFLSLFMNYFFHVQLCVASWILGLQYVKLMQIEHGVYSDKKKNIGHRNRHFQYTKSIVALVHSNLIETVHSE